MCPRAERWLNLRFATSVDAGLEWEVGIDCRCIRIDAIGMEDYLPAAIIRSALVLCACWLQLIVVLWVAGVLRAGFHVFAYSLKFTIPCSALLF